MDTATRDKWDRAAKTFDLMSGFGPERRWEPVKTELFSHMQPDANILFVALGTGLDIPRFPSGRRITAIDISPRMLDKARARVDAYDGELTAVVQDAQALEFPDDHFDQVFTSCTFCSVPDPVAGLRSLYRVLKPGGDLYMFEHTGSRWLPFKAMMDVMTPLARSVGPELNRDTTGNVRTAGFRIVSVNHIFLDVVKTIHAVKPAE